MVFLVKAVTGSK